jgi:hypothetical protein
MADGDLAAVGEAGFGRRRCLAVDHGDFVAQLLQVIGGGDAEQAGAENDDFHCNLREVARAPRGLRKKRVSNPRAGARVAAPPVLGT